VAKLVKEQVEVFLLLYVVLSLKRL